MFIVDLEIRNSMVRRLKHNIIFQFIWSNIHQSQFLHRTLQVIFIVFWKNSFEYYLRIIFHSCSELTHSIFYKILWKCLINNFYFLRYLYLVNIMVIWNQDECLAIILSNYQVAVGHLLKAGYNIFGFVNNSFFGPMNLYQWKLRWSSHNIHFLVVAILKSCADTLYRIPGNITTFYISIWKVCIVLYFFDRVHW